MVTGNKNYGNWVDTNVFNSSYLKSVQFLGKDEDEDEDEDKDESGFVPMWNWICSNVTFNFLSVILDRLQCEIGFVPLWNVFSSNMKFDFFQFEIGFVLIWNWICFNVKLNFFHCEIGFLPNPYSLISTWIHGIDLDSWYRLRDKV